MTERRGRDVPEGGLVANPSPATPLLNAAAIALAVAFSTLWCLTAASRLSATFDEPLYVARGLEGWRAGSHGGLLRLGTMPLPADVQMLPLYLAERWRGAPFDPVADLDRLLPWARALTLLFGWLLLGYGWASGQALGGDWGGRLAVLLLAVEPSLLAHASLATTDVAVSACILAFTYHFALGRTAGRFRRVAIPAFWFGVAVLAKASAIVIAPLCCVAVQIARLGRSDLFSVRAWRSFAGDTGRIIGFGLLIVFVFCGSDWQTEPSFVAWARDLPEESQLHASMTWLADHLRIFSNAGEAIFRQIRHNVRGHGSFLLGQVGSRAIWYYFPVLLTIKLCEALLVAPLLIAVLSRRALWNWALLGAALTLLYSLTFRVQLGIRMVLPLVTLLTVGVAAAFAVCIRDTLGWRRYAATTGAVAITLWSAGAVVAAWPHGLAYVNRFWGGPAEGYRLVSDSNYDWGQGLYDLVRWQSENGGGELAVWYFGTDPAVQRPPLRLVPLHEMSFDGWDDIVAAVNGCRLAVSTTLLYGTALTDPHRRAAAFLRERQPVDSMLTFLIYDVCAPGPAPERIVQP